MSGTKQQAVTSAAPPAGCPPWCVTRHGALLGEEDWVHSSAPVPVTEGVEALTCMSVDPVTGVVDGPHVVIGAVEYTPAEAAALTTALLALVDAAVSATRPAAV